MLLGMLIDRSDLECKSDRPGVSWGDHHNNSARLSTKLIGL